MAIVTDFQKGETMPKMSENMRTKDLLGFLDTGITANHAVVEIVSRLKKAGFTELDETKAWKPTKGKNYYVVRGGSSVIAFRLGKNAPADKGFRIIGAHTDVPGLRVKPNGAYTKEGYKLLGVEVYGGPILASWMDRDLTLAGKVFIKGAKGALPVARLVNFEKPICRIPQVAIHLNRTVNSEGLKLNQQNHLPPLVGMDDGKPFDMEFLTKEIAKKLKVKAAEIVDFTLEVVDTQKAVTGGFDNEFYFAGRIDNLGGSYTSLSAMLEAPATSQKNQVMVLFDNEEIGSSTLNGAASNFLDSVLERIAGGREQYLRALASTIMISNDGAHAVHPNYAEMHEPRHKPLLNKGPVLKINSKERYVTHSIGAPYFIDLCKSKGISMQKIVVRSDMPCGSTIGPIVSSRLGIDGLDVGLPMLSMHSIRETGGVKDTELMIQALKAHLS